MEDKEEEKDEEVVEDEEDKDDEVVEDGEVGEI